MIENKISKFRGHNIKQINNEWVFCKSGKPVKDAWLVCGYCGEHNTKEGNDYCLGNLPKVMNACCGHGQSKDAYVQFFNNIIVRGCLAKFAIILLKMFKK